MAVSEVRVAKRVEVHEVVVLLERRARPGKREQTMAEQRRATLGGPTYGGAVRAS